MICTKRFVIFSFTAGKVETTIRYTNRGSYSSKSAKDNVKSNDADLKYGMHEPWEAYDKCRKRERNKGWLFLPSSS